MKKYLVIDDGLVFNPDGWSDESSLDLMMEIIEVIERKGPEVQVTLKSAILSEEEVEDDAVPGDAEAENIPSKIRVTDYIDEDLYQEYKTLGLNLEQVIAMAVTKQKQLS